MPKTKKKSKKAKSSSSANIGYEAQLWQMADAMRNNMGAAVCKHVVLGLIFLKYISDTFKDKPTGLAGFVLANCSKSSTQSGEGGIAPYVETKVGAA